MTRKWLWIAAAAILIPAGIFLVYKPMSGLPDLTRLAEPKHAYSPLRIAALYDKAHLIRMQHEERLVVDGPIEDSEYTPEEMLTMYQEMYGEPVEMVEGKYIPVSWQHNPIPPVADWFSGSRKEYEAEMLEQIEHTFLDQVRLLNPKGMLTADLFSRCPSGYGYYADDADGAKDGDCWFVLVYWEGCDEDRMCTFRYHVADKSIMVRVGDDTDLVTIDAYITSLKKGIT